MSCRGVPINGWNSKAFQQIEESWGYFTKTDEVTLKDLSFAKGKVLVATKENHLIHRWIQLEVEGVVYDVEVTEDSTFVNPDEVEDFASRVNFCQEKPRREASMESGSNAGKDDDNDVEGHKVDTANRKEVVSEGDSTTRGVALHGKDKEHDGFGGSKYAMVGKHLMLEKTSTPALFANFESQVEDSGGYLEGDVGLGLIAHSKAHSVDEKGEVNLFDGDGPIGPSNKLSLEVGIEAHESHVSESPISPLFVQPGGEGDAPQGDYS